MTQAQIIKKFDRFLEETDICFDSLLDALVNDYKDAAKQQDEGGIKDCLLGVAEGLSQASMAYYASTK